MSSELCDISLHLENNMAEWWAYTIYISPIDMICLCIDGNERVPHYEHDTWSCLIYRRSPELYKSTLFHCWIISTPKDFYPDNTDIPATNAHHFITLIYCFVLYCDASTPGSHWWELDMLLLRGWKLISLAHMLPSAYHFLYTSGNTHHKVAKNKKTKHNNTILPCQWEIFLDGMLTTDPSHGEIITVWNNISSVAFYLTSIYQCWWQNKKTSVDFASTLLTKYVLIPKVYLSFLWEGPDCTEELTKCVCH